MAFWRPMLSTVRRRRRRIAWTAATVIAAGVWVSNPLWFVWCGGEYFTLEVASGAVVCVRWAGRTLPPHARGGWRSEFDRKVGDPITGFPGTYHFSLPRWGGDGVEVLWWFSLPLWMAVAMILVPTTAAWLAKPLSLAACTRCGYDLTGLAAEKGTKCPECGTPRAGHFTS